VERPPTRPPRRAARRMLTGDMRHQVAAVLAVVLSPFAFAPPSCEWWQRRYEVECLQTLYQAKALPEPEREAERQRLVDVVCADLNIAAFEACSLSEAMSLTTPAFDGWKARRTRERSRQPPTRAPAACPDKPNCV
jgi:hypothetical protein